MYNLNFDIWKFGHPQCANSANGALSKMTFSGSYSSSKPVTVEVGMTELDCSGAILQASGSYYSISCLDATQVSGIQGTQDNT